MRTNRTMKLLFLLTLSSSLVLGAGCKGSGSKKSGADKPGGEMSGDMKPGDMKPGDMKPGDMKPGARKAAGKAEKPVKMVTHDLSPAGDKWKGFSAKGPEKGCKVMKDGVSSARIGCDGPGIGDSSGRNGFDIVFTQKKVDLAKVKAEWQAIWKKRPKTKHKILADKPDLFAWQATSGKINAFHFVMQLKVGGKDVSCSTNLMVGGGTQDEHDAHLAACRSLTKK